MGAGTFLCLLHDEMEQRLGKKRKERNTHETECLLPPHSLFCVDHSCEARDLLL